MSDAPLVIDVRTTEQDPVRMFDGPVVVVEPLYGCVAVSAALDAGWSSVELAVERDGEPPMPLVSFEQVPVDSNERCRIRADSLVDAATALFADATSDGVDRPIVLGSVANARPLAAVLARVLDSSARLTFYIAPTRDANGGEEVLTADAFWASGVLIRIVLEELEGRDVQLSDSAGVAVTLAQGAEDAAAQLSSGARWRSHLERGGHADDLRVASAVDSIGVVPVLAREGGTIVATAWQP